MIKALLFDFSRVLLFPKDQTYTYGLNRLYGELLSQGSFNFFDHFELNQELLTFLSQIKDQTGLYIFTTENIQDSEDLIPFLDPIFKKIYAANRLGVSKRDPHAYTFIAEDLKLKPEEILFIDDSLENLEAAQKANFNVLLYSSNEEVIKNIQNLISK